MELVTDCAANLSACSSKAEKLAGSRLATRREKISAFSSYTDSKMEIAIESKNETLLEVMTTLAALPYAAFGGDPSIEVEILEGQKDFLGNDVKILLKRSHDGWTNDINFRAAVFFAQHGVFDRAEEFFFKGYPVTCHDNFYGITLRDWVALTGMLSTLHTYAKRLPTSCKSRDQLITQLAMYYVNVGSRHMAEALLNLSPSDPSKISKEIERRIMYLGRVQQVGWMQASKEIYPEEWEQK